MVESKVPLPMTGPEAEQQMRRLTRRSFVTGTLAAAAGLGAWRWLTTATPEDGVPWPLRHVLRFNQGLVEGLGSPHGLAPTFPAESVQGSARVNGLIGLADEVEVEATGWQLSVQHEGRGAQSIP